MSAPKQTITYNVTGVVPYTDYQPGGRAVDGFRIYFHTSTNLDGQVFAPAAVASNPDQLAALLNDTVANMAAVHMFSGQIEV